MDFCFLLACCETLMLLQRLQHIYKWYRLPLCHTIYIYVNIERNTIFLNLMKNQLQQQHPRLKKAQQLTTNEKRRKEKSKSAKVNYSKFKVNEFVHTRCVVNLFLFCILSVCFCFFYFFIFFSFAVTAKYILHVLRWCARFFFFSSSHFHRANQQLLLLLSVFLFVECSNPHTVKVVNS